MTLGVVRVGRPGQPVATVRDVLRAIGNVLRFILAGIWLALGYAFAGLVMCITIIGIPFGIQAFKLAGFTIWPIGKTVMRRPDGGVLEVVFNVFWLILFGWVIFVAHLIAGVVLCVTIIGVPFGIQAFKLSMLALWPFGRFVAPRFVPPRITSTSYCRVKDRLPLWRFAHKRREVMSIDARPVDHYGTVGPIECAELLA